MEISATIAETRFHVEPADLNYLGVLYGGKLLYELDQAMAAAVRKFTPEAAMTGSVDKVRFIKPFAADSDVLIKSFVAGASGRVIEVVAEVYNEQMELGAYATMTFVVLRKDYVVPELTATTTKEQQLLATFAKRQKLANEYHQLIKTELDDNYEK